MPNDTNHECNGSVDPLEMIEYLTTNAKKVQNQVLATILTRNAKTEYLTRYSLDGRVLDKASFKKLIPVVSYEDVEPYINRIANGDKAPILSAEPISEFLTSSGTSAGERKLMPTIPEELERKKFLYSLLMPVMNQYLPGLDKGKGLYFLFIKAETKTPGGLLARPVLTSYYKSSQFRDIVYDPFNVYTSPTETILCPDAYQSMYCQMLCGLVLYGEVLRMGAVFASGFLRAIKFLEENWQELCHDIRRGDLSSKVSDVVSREAVMKILKGGDPKLAERIERECAKDSWQGIISRLWPKVRYIEVVVTGTMSQYIPTLDHYSGGLPLACTMYASSECYFGLNLKPLSRPSEVSYTLLSNMGYFEFIPLKRGSNTMTKSSPHNKVNGDHHGLHHENGHLHTDTDGNRADDELATRLLDLTELTVGEEYELVVTTYAGLYRYKVGDVLKVTGYHHQAPQFQFICRKNVVLSIDADKTDEDCLHSAVRAAAKRLRSASPPAASPPWHLVEYTSFADTSSIPGHYVIFWELRSPSATCLSLPTLSLLESCCLSLEDSLDSVYRQCRNCDRSIGPLEIRIVQPGTFDLLMDFCVQHGSSINQYKTPRCIKPHSPALDLLNSKVILKGFSPSLPFWAPQRREWTRAA
ncbi:hypothetical protein GOP47_0015736 [Adiantum capillus-veneris]|uniref:Uncharacterized protein n=1 Tax=Adiantum capillus-veneris TaxID=13818 RepID=A0A9D4UK98_ADICA|nr:hypothetical protein GOP47_0015736 [Adiantum capillus-veneris]